MLAALADLSLRRPWQVLAGSAVVLAAATGLALGAPGELGIGSLRLAQPDEPVPARVGEFAIGLSSPSESPGSRVFDVAADVVAAQVESDPAVESVSRRSTGEGVALAIDFGDASRRERQAALIRLEDAVDPGALRADFDGELVRLLDARRELTAELWRAELVALPVALLLLVAFAGGVRALAPLACSAIAIVGSLALLRIAAPVADPSLLGFAPAAAVGLALGIELPLLLLAVHDDEGDGARGVRAAVEDGGRVAVAAGILAALPAFALLATPLGQNGSLAAGCALASLLALAATLTVTPALLAVRSRRRETHPQAAREPGELADLGATLAGSRWLAAGGVALAAVVLAEAALPLLDLRTVPFGAPLALDGDSLIPELPAAGAIAAAILLVGLTAATRGPAAIAAAVPTLLPAAAAIGVTAVLVQADVLAAAGPAEALGALDTGAVAIAVAALAAISAARSAAALFTARDERLLGLPPAAAAELAGQATLRPAAASTLIVGMAACGLIAWGFSPARQLGTMIIVGLLADLVFARIPVLAAGARWVGWPRWRGRRLRATGSAG